MFCVFFGSQAVRFLVQVLDVFLAFFVGCRGCGVGGGQTDKSADVLTHSARLTSSVCTDRARRGCRVGGKAHSTTVPTVRMLAAGKV